jgi:uncharacterized protein YegJ (DUF2314 family)
MQARKLGRLAGYAILSAGLVWGNADALIGGAVASDGAGAGHAAMQKAEASARTHLDRFLSHVLPDGGASAEGASVRVVIADGDGGSYRVWVSPFVRDGGDRFEGRVSNAPRQAGIGIGDPIRFARQDIRDWSFTGDDGKVYGNHTTRVLLGAMKPETAAAISSVLSEDPVPEGW